MHRILQVNRIDEFELQSQADKRFTTSSFNIFLTNSFFNQNSSNVQEIAHVSEHTFMSQYSLAEAAAEQRLLKIVKSSLHYQNKRYTSAH